MKRLIKILGIILTIVILFWILPIPDLLAYKISKSDSVPEGGVGFAGIEPKQFKRYKRLKLFSDSEKLEKLYFKHSSPSVLCYTYWALTEYEDIDFIKLLRKSINDNRVISHGAGCIIQESTVSDFLIDKTTRLLSTTDSLALVEMILNSSACPVSQQKLLQIIPIEEKHYEQIRQLAMEQKSSYAIVALSRFQNLNDTGLIRKSLTDTLPDQYYFLLASRNIQSDNFIDDLVAFHTYLLKSKINYPGYQYKRLIPATYLSMVQYYDERITNNFNWLIEINRKLELNDTISINKPYYSEIEEFFGVNPDSSKYILDNEFTSKDKDLIKIHLYSLKLALHFFPDSKYIYLKDKIQFDSKVQRRIENEIYITE